MCIHRAMLLCSAVALGVAVTSPCHGQETPNRDRPSVNKPGTAAEKGGMRINWGSAAENTVKDDKEVLSQEEIQKIIKRYNGWLTQLRRQDFAAYHAPQGGAYFEHLVSVIETTMETLKDNEKISKKSWVEYVREEWQPAFSDLMVYRAMQYDLKAYKKRSEDIESHRIHAIEMLKSRGVTDYWGYFDNVAATSRPKAFELGVKLHFMERVDGQFKEIKDELRFFGGPYFVEARYEEAPPGEASVTISISGGNAGDLSITAKRTEDPRVYRSDEFYVLPPMPRDLDTEPSTLGPGERIEP